MRKIIWMAAAAMAGLSGCSAGADKTTAQNAVREFREMLAAERYADIYQRSAVDMKTSASEQNLTNLLRGVRTHYGAFQSANETGWHWNVNNGVTRVTLNYDTQYANGRANEGFVYRIEGGQAQLAGYNINAGGASRAQENGGVAVENAAGGK